MEHFPFIKKSIESADFVAFDFEFSGLNSCQEDQTHEFDSDEARYQKLKNTVQRMNAFQIGLSTFKYDATEKKIISRPFNIYLFPYSDNHINYYRNGLLDQAQVLEFSPSCLRFNTRNNFNFNKLFRMGLNYRRIST